MNKNYVNPTDEITDLKQALENFKQEKERVRLIIGKIGGIPSFHTKLINAVFVAVIIGAAWISVFADEKLRLLMVELTTVMLSMKIIYMIHIQTRVNHFKFWILSAIEGRINEMMAEIRPLKKQRDRNGCFYRPCLLAHSPPPQTAAGAAGPAIPENAACPVFSYSTRPGLMPITLL